MHKLSIYWFLGVLQFAIIALMKPKATLYYFFIVEHFVVAFLFVFGFLAARSIYANSPANFVSQRVEFFESVPQEVIVSKLSANLAPQVMNQMLNKGSQEYTVSLSEQEVNSLLFSANLNISHVEKLYLAFEGENTVYLWVKIKDLSEPLIASTSFEYINREFILYPKSLNLGIVPLPVGWLDYFSGAISKSITELVQKLELEYGMELVSVSSTSEAATAKARVDALELFNR